MNTNTNVLTAIREKKSTYNMVTTLKDKNGFVKAILNGYNQPTKRLKTIEIEFKILKEKVNIFTEGVIGLTD